MTDIVFFKKVIFEWCYNEIQKIILWFIIKIILSEFIALFQFYGVTAGTGMVQVKSSIQNVGNMSRFIVPIGKYCYYI